MAPDFIEFADVGRRELPAVLYELVGELAGCGWRIRRQGHKFRLYCPCGTGTVRIDGTPQNAENQARRARREAARCPDNHALDG